MTTRFSQLYIDHGPLVTDSARFRKRVGYLLQSRMGKESRTRLARHIQAEQGVDVQTDYKGYNMEKFFREAEVRDVLDAITGAYMVLVKEQISSFGAREFVGFANRALREEGSRA